MIRTLQKDAFLGADVPVDGATEVPHFARHRELALDVNRYALSLTKVDRAKVFVGHVIAALGLFNRALQEFEACVLLADRGLRAQARSMARSTFETALYCTAAFRDLTLTTGVKGGTTLTFMNGLLGDHELFRRKTALEIIELPGQEEAIKNKMRALIAEIDSRGPYQGINVFNLAKDLGIDLYLLYRQLSQDAHPSATSVDHHFEQGELGEDSRFRIGPDYYQYDDTLMAAISSILIACEAHTAHFEVAQERAGLESLVKYYKALAKASPD